SPQHSSLWARRALPARPPSSPAGRPGAVGAESGRRLTDRVFPEASCLTRIRRQRKIGPAPMTPEPSIASFGLLFALSFFLGMAFEDFFARAATRRPGGIRTFPLLALAGGMLYLFDPTRLIPFTGGLLVLGAWLLVFYHVHIHELDEEGEPNVGVMVPLLNVHAYVLGAVALALPKWVAVGTTVAAVLLLTGRARLHELARRIEMKEIVTAGPVL